MPLTLTVTSYKGAPPSKPASISIEHESISIGRQKGNSLVLNDPESVVSSRHAEIEYRNDGYYITDTSTNHTLIDQTDEPLNESQTLRDGQSAKLNNNNLLTFGDYEIMVEITSHRNHAASDDLSAGDGYENPESLLTNDDKLDSGSGDPFADIVAVVEKKKDLLDQKAQHYDANDDFSFLDSISDSDQMSVDNGLPNPDATDLFADIESAQEDKDKLSHANAQDDEVTDDFSFLDSISDSDQMSADKGLPNPDPTDPFADIESAQEDKDNLSHADTTDHKATDEFSFLDSISDSDQMSADKGSPNPGATDPFADIESAQEDKDNLSQANAPSHKANDEFGFLDSIEKSDQLRTDNDITNTDTKVPFAEIEPAIEDKKKSFKKPDTATTKPRKPAQQSPSTSDTGVELEHIQNFLRGAGIESSGIANTINANTFYLIGQLLSRSLEGAIQVLWARSKIKNELGLEVTIVHGRGNNPLKFSPSAQESLVKLLDPQGKAYMPANEAIDEAFSDIGAHEMAVMAGMRSALYDVLKRFDPEYLEQRLQKKSPTSARIPILKQALQWDLFQDLYGEIEKEAQDDFNRLFGRAFAKAYDDHLRKTKNNR